MFDDGLPEAAELRELSGVELIDAARGWARAENAACARKLAVMAEIFARRTGLPAGDRELWWIDPEAAVAAELAAALNVTAGLALHQTHRGVALRDRLPNVAALFEAGQISEILVRAIVWRTYLINDDAAMAAVDAELAAQISSWGALSAAKTEAAIDEMVDRHDPGALRVSRESSASRDVEFGGPSDTPGFTSLWARMHAADGAVMRDRMDAMAHGVCEADPRSIDERRNDAFAAIGAGLDTLACRCGTDDCEAAGRDRPGRNTTVFVVGDAATLEHTRRDNTTGPEDPAGPQGPDGGDEGPAGPEDCGQPEGPGGSGAGAGSAEDSRLSPPARCEDPRLRPGWVFGAGIVPTPLLGGLIDGARIRRIIHPGDAPAEDRYTPSRGLAEFIRCRDLTCRFPGCNKPATEADLDHTVPYPVGPTHASNIKCLCRFHHLLKTFWTGPDGWRDRQYPDGTVIWTSPTGHTYTTHPGSRMLFPDLCKPTATLWDKDPPAPDTTPGREAMMPKRRRTRAQNRARAIAAERKLNDEHVAEQNKPPPF